MQVADVADTGSGGLPRTGSGGSRTQAGQPTSATAATLVRRTLHFDSRGCSMATFHTPMITLSDGNLIPQIGLGVLRIDDEALPPWWRARWKPVIVISTVPRVQQRGGRGARAEKRGFTQGENRKNLWVTTKLRDSSRGTIPRARRSTASSACCSSIMWTCICCIGRRRSTGVPVRLGRRSTNSARRAVCVRLACAISAGAS